MPMVKVSDINTYYESYSGSKSTGPDISSWR